MGLPYPFRHPPVQWLHQVRDIPAPHRWGGSGNGKALRLEDIFQPIEWKVISELAGNDVGQQPRTRKAFFDRRLRFRRCRDLRIFSRQLTLGAGILLAHMPQALEVSGEVFDLPALLAADFLSLLAAARAASLFGRKLIDVRADRKIFEIR